MSDRAVPALAVLAGLALLSDDEDFSYAGLKGKFRSAMLEDPFDTTIQMVLGASVLFYLAERDTNPKVDSLAAAMEVMATSMNVGSTNIYPETQLGQLLAAGMMTMGPSMVTSFLDPPGVGHPTRASGEASNDVIAEKLEAILQELRAQRTG